jgi:hypothetical protein
MDWRGSSIYLKKIALKTAFLKRNFAANYYEDKIN